MDRSQTRNVPISGISNMINKWVMSKLSSYMILGPYPTQPYLLYFNPPKQPHVNEEFKVRVDISRPILYPDRPTQPIFTPTGDDLILDLSIVLPKKKKKKIFP